eukprot:COSAG02_NODE_9101_length_2330_cov_2.510982_2_plen_82_part_00
MQHFGLSHFACVELCFHPDDRNERIGSLTRGRFYSVLQNQYQLWFDELGCESQLVDLHGNVALIAASRSNAVKTSKVVGRL